MAQTDWLSSVANNRQDWSLLKSFWDVARIGSLRGAAVEQKLSINTVRSRIERLERTTKHALFDRSIRGMSLTQHGQELYRMVDLMAAAIGIASPIPPVENEIEASPPT